MRAALAFLTCIGGPTSPRPAALPWFPVVGAGLGLALGGIWWIAGGLWPPVLAAALVVVADLALTGMLHLDGLADSADGLLAHGLDRDRRLQIMAEPTVGAFALGTVALTLIGRVAALAALSPSPLVLAAVWATSRAAMALAVVSQPYARDRGLASSFRPVRPSAPGAAGAPGPAGAVVLAWAVVLVAVLVAAGIGSGPVGAGPARIGVAVVAAAAAAAGVVALARARIGGYSGDVLGAAGVLAETLGLVAVAARW